MTNKKPACYAGHGIQTDGTFDCGCVYKKNGIVHTEADKALRITKWAVRYMRACKLTVITDAFSKNDINMIMQVAKSNLNHADVHVAIHLDYSLAPSGCVPLYASDKGKKLAECINKRLTPVIGKSRGISRRTDLYELNATEMPACIVEVGSIKADLDVINAKPRTIGKAIAHGICDYLNVEWEYKYYKTKKATKGRYTASSNGKVRKSISKNKKISIWKLSKSKKWGYSPIYGWVKLEYLKEV